VARALVAAVLVEEVRQRRPPGQPAQARPQGRIDRLPRLVRGVLDGAGGRVRPRPVGGRGGRQPRRG
jgi:hypothetical protein